MTQTNGSQPDKRALKILLGRYWSPQGWVPDSQRTLALGSYAVFRHVREHDPMSEDGRSCDVCGLCLNTSVEDLNVLNFERFKWGGVRHTSPLYAMLDLELFIESGLPQPSPTDIQIFRDLVRVLEQLPSGISGAALQGRLATVFKSNKGERDSLVAILGYCGVLSIPGHSGFAEEFVPAKQRALPHYHFVDMPYPACWWRSEHGIDRARLNEYFGHIL